MKWIFYWFFLDRLWKSMCKSKNALVRSTVESILKRTFWWTQTKITLLNRLARALFSFVSPFLSCCFTFAFVVFHRVAVWVKERCVCVCVVSIRSTNTFACVLALLRRVFEVCAIVVIRNYIFASSKSICVVVRIPMYSLSLVAFHHEYVATRQKQYYNV